MVQIYYILICNHMKTLSDVPAALQTAVQAKLTAAGLDGSGNSIPSAS